MDIRQEVLDVDLHNLTEALQNHTAWFEHYTQELPELKRGQMEAKEQYERMKSSLYLEFKKDPPDGMKVTEATLDALVATDQRTLDAHKAWMDIKQRHDEVERFRDLFERRERSLTMLVQLYRAQYWGTHQPGDDPEESEVRRSAPRRPIEREAEEADLDGIKERLAERARSRTWNRGGDNGQFRRGT